MDPQRHPARLPVRILHLKAKFVEMARLTHRSAARHQRVRQHDMLRHAEVICVAAVLQNLTTHDFGLPAQERMRGGVPAALPQCD